MARRLTAVLAHPDDESFPIGGTLARYAGTDLFTGLAGSTRSTHEEKPHVNID